MVREETLQAVAAIPDTHSIIERAKRVLAPYQHEVRFAFLFGSYAKGVADSWSDVDIGIYIAGDVADDKRNEIRFALMDVLVHLETQIGYLDDEDISPEIFVAATEGIPIVVNDDDTYHEVLLKNVHALEEMRLIGLVK